MSMLLQCQQNLQNVLSSLNNFHGSTGDIDSCESVVSFTFVQIVYLKTTVFCIDNEWCGF